MYTTFVSVLRRVVGGGLAQHLMWIIPVCAVASLLLLLNPPWRRLERAAREGRSRIGLLVLFLGAGFRLLVMACIVGGLAAALLVQEGLFGERHGRVTQRNYEAVRTKWGVPHEQCDLTVSHYVMREVITEESADGLRRERELDKWRVPQGDETRVILDEETIPDPAGVEIKKLSPKRIVRRTRMLKRRSLPGDSIRRSETMVDLASNSRRLGGAVYAGYEDTWRFRYELLNPTGRATQAYIRFPLPAGGHGLFDRLSLRLNGVDWLPKVRFIDGGLAWRMPMKPNESAIVEVGYASRGMSHFRYRPGDLRESCLVTVNVKGIPAHRLNFPIGSMPPRENLAALSGEDYALTWDLSRAVTNLDIGIIVPNAPQPGYHIAKLLGAAPTGLLLLAAALLLTRWAQSRRLDLVPVAVVLVTYYVAHALMANLNDVTTSFASSFAVSMVPLAVSAAALWALLDRGSLRWLLPAALVGVFFLAYPLSALAGEATDTLHHVLYAAMTVYALLLVAYMLRKEERSLPEGGQEALREA